MRKIIYVLSIALVLISCKKEEPKDYVTLVGKITNQNSDSLMIYAKGFQKKIDLNADGTFADTLKIVNGNFILFDGKEKTAVYLKNGYDLKITLDTKEFDETISYFGEGADANNYLAARALFQEGVFTDNSMYDLDKTKFDEKNTEIGESLKELLDKTQNLDADFIAKQNKENDGLIKYIANRYEEKQYLVTVLGRGKVSPEFNEFENYKGGTTSLDDLKGKYVYIDVWATWCGPCKAQIPFLKEVEKTYHGKNIEFVSISVDKAKNHDSWKKMIEEKELSGIQLFADKDWNSSFVQDYKIKGIPRFILIDPLGNIVSSDAPRPSSEDLKMLFKELNI